MTLPRRHNNWRRNDWLVRIFITEIKKKWFGDPDSAKAST